MDANNATKKDVEPVKLDKEVLLECARKARRDAIFAGITSGCLGGLIGYRYFRFSRNQTLATGILTCAASGYFFIQAFMGSRVSLAVARETKRRQQAASFELMPDNTFQEDSTKAGGNA